MKESEEIKQVLAFVAINGPSHSLVINACEVLGINSQELIEKNLKDFTVGFGGKDISEINYRNYEARRRAKLALISKFIADKTQSSPKQDQILTSPKPKITPLITKLLPSPAKCDLAERNLSKKLKAAKNLKAIKINEEKTRKFYEEKLNTKSSREAKSAFSAEQKSRYVQRDLKTRAILSKRYKDIEDHERRAITSMSVQKDFLITQSSINTPKKPSRVSTGKNSFSSFSHQEDYSINDKLKKISIRLTRSSERAQQIKARKLFSVNSLTSRVNQVRAMKELIDSKMEAKNIEKVFRIKKEFMDSCKRKEELLEEEQRRISISLQKQSNRWNEEYLKVEQAFKDREKKIELRIKEKERSRENKIGQRYMIRNKEELGAGKMKDKFEDIRGKMMGRLKGSEIKIID